MGSFINLGYSQTNQTKDIAPGVQIQSQQSKEESAIIVSDTPTNTGSATEAMWDTQFVYDVSDSVLSAGLAGAIQVGTEFWVSRWQSDTLYRLTSTGSLINAFTVANGANTVTGTRGMTTDGTNVYIGNATTTIYQVNPATFTVTGTITSQGQPARFISYDPTADGGLGGFWIGNFNTDIQLISRSGVVLSTIGAATHGVGGIYGAAFDNISNGGPYLWVFAQSSNPSNGMIHQLQLPTGFQTGVVRDVDVEYGDGTSLAGGLFISSNLVPGKNTIAGLLQGSPNKLIGYELDFVPIQIDANIVASGQSPAWGHIPLRFNQTMTFGGSVQNYGQQTITSVNANLTIANGGTNVFSDDSARANLANFQVFNYSFDPYTPPVEGNYTATTTVTTGAQTDEIPSNNISTLYFNVTDSVFSYDDGNSIGSYSANFTDPVVVAVVYEFPKAVYLQGLEVVVGDPTTNAGAIMTGQLYAVDVTNKPTGTPLLSSSPLTIVAGQDRYFFKFSASLPVTAGQKWAIAFTQNAGDVIGIAHSPNYYNAATVGNFFTTDGGTTWSQSSVPTARFIRPVFVSCKDFSLDVEVKNFNTGLSQQGEITVTPNGSPNYTYQWNDPNNSTTATVTNLAPGSYTVTVNDGNSCSLTQTIDVLDQTSIEDDLAAGINTFEVYPNPTQGVVNLNIEMGQISDLSLTIFDLNGKAVYSEAKQRINTYQKAVDLSALSSGVYMLQAITSKGRTFKRIVLN
ncbi:MAG: T9SS type A sorting domain-containing protein [Bacteroidetes bacterium]|nr:T9SS type A sorting domain-containing protein [Bacteroidota bacterium]